MSNTINKDKAEILIDDIPAPLMVLNENGDIESVNNEWKALCNYQETQAVGKNLEELLVVDSEEDKHEMLGSLLSGRTVEKVICIKCGDGKHKTVKCRIKPKHNGPGEAKSTLWMLGEVEDAGKSSTVENVEAKIEALSNVLPDLVYFKDLRGRNIEVNSVFEEFLGLSKEEIIGKTDYELFPKDLADYCKSSDDYVLETGKIYEIEEKMGGEDGPGRYFRTLKAPVMDKEGKVSGLVGMSRDVTEEVVGKQTIEREKTVFLSGPVVVFVWRNEEGWPVEFVSENTEEVLGYTAEQFMNSEVLYADIIFETDLDRVAGEVAYYSKSKVGRFRHEPYRVVRKDGVPIWVDDYTTVVRDADGEITHFIGYILDVTAYRETDAALQESRERYRAILDSIDDLVYICGPDCVIEYLNSAMIKKVGRNAVGEKCYKAIHGLDEKCDWCMLENILKLKSYNYKMVSPGDGRDYVVSGSPVFHSDGTISKMAIYRDVTEMQNAIEKLISMSHMIINAQENERERVARELHDSIGQKIVALQIKAGITLRNAGDKKVKDGLQFIFDLAENAADELGIICKGLRPTLLNKVGLIAAIEEFVSDIEKFHRLRIEFETYGVNDVLLDSSLAINIFRVVQESVNNMLRHSSAKHARIDINREDDKIILRIADDGCGFDTGGVNESECFGLMGMKERAMLCDGFLNIESHIGQGTVITLEIEDRTEN